jgi:hypothetical protein
VTEKEREQTIQHYKEKEEIDKKLREECILYLEENFPDYENVFAYWND